MVSIFESILMIVTFHPNTRYLFGNVMDLAKKNIFSDSSEAIVATFFVVGSNFCCLL